MGATTALLQGRGPVAALCALLVAGSVAVLRRNGALAALAAATVADVAAPGAGVAAWALCAWRVWCAALVWGVAAAVALDPEPTVLELAQGKRFVMAGRVRFTTFTVISWTSQGVFFTLALACHAAAAAGAEAWLPRWLPALAVGLFQVHTAVAPLITLVVTLVLLPAARRAGVDVTRPLLSVRALLMHNANTLNMAGELALNALRIPWSHAPLALLYGMAYVAFAWAWHRRTGVFYYFFLDPLRPRAVVAYVALCATLLACFALVAGASSLLGK